MQHNSYQFYTPDNKYFAPLFHINAVFFHCYVNLWDAKSQVSFLMLIICKKTYFSY